MFLEDQSSDIKKINIFEFKTIDESKITDRPSTMHSIS